MTDSITVTPAQIANALDRAVRYRRSLVPAEWQGKPNLTELISTQSAHPPRFAGDGRWHVGNVLDSFSERQPILAVYLHPATDQVQVQRPPKRPRMPDPEPPIYTEQDFNQVGRKTLGYQDKDQ